MRCPECGKELPDDKLYCEECGSEIRIVPDFEPEVEKKISETLLSLAEGLEEEKDDARIADKVQNKKQTRLLFMGVTMVLGILLIIAGIFIYQYNSYSYQKNHALQAGEKQQYNRAIQYMERAITLQPSDKDAEFLLADYYNQLGQADNAIYLLQDYIATKQDNITKTDQETAYSKADGYHKLITIYEVKKQYAAINELLLNCQDTAMIGQYSAYAAFPPEFSLEEGTYDKVVPLKLMSNTTGVIYYTLDGSTPTKQSSRYTGPIFLEEGSHEINAIFINNYGFTSEIATGHYFINLVKLPPPEVSLYSGTYNRPQRIVVDVPFQGEVYYTLDGTEPTKESIQYESPINMPLGESHYKFIIYNEEGATSEITERHYQMELSNVNVPYQDAIDRTVLFLHQAGYLTDLQGHALNIVGSYLYTCNTAIQVDNQIYYLIAENHIEPSGVQNKTGNLFAISASNGLIYKASLNSKKE
ncbi:MAG: chitobiase/beta-hexosaminidase C-terminal domain-containing protein, partial [Lachnospiraceae bacterium]